MSFAKKEYEMGFLGGLLTSKVMIALSLAEMLREER